MFEIEAIPVLKDNYVWCLIEPQRSAAIVIDPGEATPVIQYLKQLHLDLTAVLITHHHADHCGGVHELVKHYNVPVYGKEVSQDTGVTSAVSSQSLLKLTSNGFTFNFGIMHIPGHTLDHTAFYMPGVLFCGDTLFSAGCGRIFEGTPAQMYQSLMAIAALPEDTKIYCGHEYTLNNLKFAEAVEPDNKFIQEYMRQVKALLSNKKMSLPSLLSDEMKMNPFLRCHEASVVAAAEKFAGKKLEDAVEVFTVIRQWKNGFVA